MLHSAILPFHGDWAWFLSRLDWIVVDELHVHRGLFGSHVANVLRRLERVAAVHGARPRYVATSATLRNPGTLFASLTGRKATVVDDDGAPSGARDVVFWVPPSRPGSEVRRKSPVVEAAEIAGALVEDGIKALVFCNARRAAELLVRYARSRLPDASHARIDVYRAGYSAEERRTLERRFGEGAVTVLATTSAMELGVDVGAVDAVVLAGFPGSIMSYRQRIGRAGRRGSRSLAVLVPDDDPLSEHYLRHPDHLLGDDVEAAVADPFGPSVHPRHVVCAAAEVPVERGEGWLDRGLDLADVDGLVERGGRFHARRRYPHGRVALRGRGGERIDLIEAGSGRRLGHLEAGRAVRECHTGAVYLHRGEAFLVAELNLAHRQAALVPHIEDWYTQVRSETRIELLEDKTHGDERLHLTLGLPSGVAVGSVRVVHEVHGFVRKRYRSEAVVAEEVLDLPPEAFDTVACWLTMDEEWTATAATAGPVTDHSGSA
jgi:DEAD/DEAH box helicase domain-containing protein